MRRNIGRIQSLAKGPLHQQSFTPSWVRCGNVQFWAGQAHFWVGQVLAIALCILAFISTPWWCMRWAPNGINLLQNLVSPPEQLLGANPGVTSLAVLAAPFPTPTPLVSLYQRTDKRGGDGCFLSLGLTCSWPCSWQVTLQRPGRSLHWHWGESETGTSGLSWTLGRPLGVGALWVCSESCGEALGSCSFLLPAMCTFPIHVHVLWASFSLSQAGVSEGKKMVPQGPGMMPKFSVQERTCHCIEGTAGWDPWSCTPVADSSSFWRQEAPVSQQNPNTSLEWWREASCCGSSLWALPWGLVLLNKFECLKQQRSPFQALLGSHKQQKTKANK